LWSARDVATFTGDPLEDLADRAASGESGPFPAPIEVTNKLRWRRDEVVRWHAAAC
jgi:hypothetical protein